VSATRCRMNCADRPDFFVYKLRGLDSHLLLLLHELVNFDRILKARCVAIRNLCCWPPLLIHFRKIIPAESHRQASFLACLTTPSLCQVSTPIASSRPTVIMGSIYYLTHPTQLRSIIQWYVCTNSPQTHSRRRPPSHDTNHDSPGSYGTTQSTGATPRRNRQRCNHASNIST
jgi:hypothetical protein